MTKSPFKVVWVKALIAFQIPFFTALGGALTPYTMGTVTIPTSHFLRILLVVIVLSAALVAGYSGLGSFLSTTFSEHKAKADAANDDEPETTPQVIPEPTAKGPTTIGVSK